MTPSMILDGLKAVATLSGFAIARRGRSCDVAVTGAGREERCRGRDFEDKGAVQCAPYCTRIVSNYQNDEAAPPSAHGDAPTPRRYADMVAKPPIGRAAWLVTACHSAGCGVWILPLSVQTTALASSPVMPLRLYQRVRARYED